MTSSTEQPREPPTAWKRRRDNQAARAFAAHQRGVAVLGREEAATVREQAAGIRADAAQFRDLGARTRDDAARVRDSAALVRDMAARTRDQATKTREEATRRRLLARSEIPASSFWQELLELDRVASQQSREAATHDRDAAGLDRTAADKDRDAAERDRTAAARDREAADKDREAAEKDRVAADADRAAADSDRAEADQELVVAEGHLTQTERQALLGRMAAEIAHQINNPLAALLTNLASMQAFSSPELAPMLADAAQAAGRISEVVVELKAWLSGTGPTAVSEVIDFPALVRSALQLTPEVERAALVTVELLPTGTIQGSASRLSLVISSLLSNAAQAIAGPRDGNRISLRLHEEAGMACFEVVDTGVGIDPSVLPHIFEPLFTTRQGEGTRGLGLALCRRIVTDHGGFLTVETEVGVGTTLLVRLPCVQRSVVKPVPGAPRATVLLIDDDVVLSRSLGRLLATRCMVTFAHNGAEALAQLTAPGASFDVVLCDVMMPVLNGLELHRELLRVAPAIAAQLIFLSGGATTREAALFLESVPNTVVQKPFDIHALFSLSAARAAHRTTA